MSISLETRLELVGEAIQRSYGRLDAGSQATKEHVMELIAYLELQYKYIEDALWYDDQPKTKEIDVDSW